MLTGTPLQNDLQELQNLLRFLLPDLFKAEDELQFDARQVSSPTREVYGMPTGKLACSPDLKNATQAVTRASSLCCPPVGTSRGHRLLPVACLHGPAPVCLLADT